jgi:hypothetical protein
MDRMLEQPTTTIVSFLLDRSGSMAANRLPRNDKHFAIICTKI